MLMNELNFVHADVLKELGTIGAGNAAGTLAKMINRKIKMNIPKATFLEFKDLAEEINGAENLISGILVKLGGEISGIMMFILEEGPACNLIKAVLGKDVNGFMDCSEMELSVIEEIGNILSSSYLGALSTMTSLKITPSVPYLSIDMAGAILSVPAIEFGKVCDKVLFIQSSFMGDGQDVSGNFILVPDIESFRKILDSLGVK